VRLDYQEIHHNYVTRLVIFSVFLYKETRKQENVYNQSVRGFLKKRIPYDIDLSIEVGPKMSLDEQRDNAIDLIFGDTDKSILNLVVVQFRTGHKEVTLQIDLNQEQRYEGYLYS
jgi:hypothetical protein